MEAYFLYKHYKSTFCDLVPVIITNVLKRNIVILEKGRDEVHVYRIEKNGKQS